MLAKKLTACCVRMAEQVWHLAHQRPPQLAVVRSTQCLAGTVALSRGIGLQVVVITGDNKLTAEAVCRSIGVFSKTEDVSSKSMTGMEFKKLPAAKQREMLMVRGCTQHHSSTFSGPWCWSAADSPDADVLRLPARQMCVPAAQQVLHGSVRVAGDAASPLRHGLRAGVCPLHNTYMIVVAMLLRGRCTQPAAGETAPPQAQAWAVSIRQVQHCQ